MKLTAAVSGRRNDVTLDIALAFTNGTVTITVPRSEPIEIPADDLRDALVALGALPAPTPEPAAGQDVAKPGPRPVAAAGGAKA